MMENHKITRRRFINAASTAAVFTMIGGFSQAFARAANKEQSRKMLLSFYCDDTGPYRAGAEAFEIFLNYCAEHRIAGESSVILGGAGRSMSRNPKDEEQAYLSQVRRAFECGIDTHMEIMTHGGLFDFEKNNIPEGAAHEGLWLHEPEVTVEEYQDYFASIIAEGEKAGIQFTGLTWPGCGCDVCTKRYAELRAAGVTEPNPKAWQALLNLTKKGKFRGRTISCFFGSSETKYGIHLKARDGEYGVYDLMPNARDNFGIWENNPERVNADYYITDDGESGIIVDHVRKGAPYCVWYGHWQGLNPVSGLGWSAFTTVIDRINRHLRDRVVWMRPSEITDRYHAAGGWQFLDSV
jgi:hypothetical protein